MKPTLTLPTSLAAIIFVLFVLLPAAFVKGQIPPGFVPGPLGSCFAANTKIAPSLGTVKAGATVEFEIVSKDGENIQGEFDWEISTGTIVKGQGTRHIVVLTPADALIAKKDQPPRPDSGSTGFIVSIWGGGRRHVPLTVTARLNNKPACGDSKLSVTMYIANRSEAVNLPADVTKLIFDKIEVIASCDKSEMPRGDSSSTDMIIEVSVKAADPENDVLMYDYTVSGGKIVGVGAQVKWNLTGLGPGTYSLTVGVDDGCGVCGKTKTESVTIRKCDGPTVNR